MVMNPMLTLTAIAVCFVFLSGVLAMVDAAVLSVSRAETEEAVAHERIISWISAWTSGSPAR